MRNTRKILIALLVVMTLLVSMVVVASAAATTGNTTIYLTPNANWKVDNARFALYTWDGGDQWFDMTDTNGDGIYECVIPAGIENIIFCRMNPSATANNWNNKWNQTSDLKYDGSNNHYTVTEGTWDKGGGTWSLLEIGECIHAPSGEGEVVTAATCTENGEIAHTCSKCGENYSAVILATGHTYEGSDAVCACGVQAKFNIAGDNATLFGAEWDAESTANYLKYDEATGLWSISYTNNGTASVWPNFKICLDNGWNTCWGGSAAGQSDDNAWVEIPAGKVLTISFDYANEKITFATSDPHVHSYFYPCDPVCQECYEISNPDATHNIVHVEAKAGTDCQTYDGNVEYWYCSDCGAAWADEALTQVTNRMNVVAAGAHTYTNACDKACAVCYEVTRESAEHTIVKVEAKAGTDCQTWDGNVEYWTCSDCGYAWADEALTQPTNRMSIVAAGAHKYADGKCSVCEAEDPDYVAPEVPTVKPIVNVSDLAAGETTGEELIAGTGISASAGLTIDSNSKSVDGFSFTLRLKLGGTLTVTDGVVTAGVKIVTNGPAKIVVYALSSSSSDATRTLQIGTLNEDGTFNQLAVTGALEDTKNPTKCEFTVDAAGTYYLGSTKSGINLYYIAVDYSTETPHEHVWSDATCTEPQKCECGETQGEALGHSFANGVCSVCNAEDPNYVPPHVNTLVVGETNKIVVSGNFVNDYNLPIEWVSFVADENAFYSFVGDTGALAFIFDANGALVSGTGAANLEAGSYLICVGNGVVGEFNVAVTKSAWVNALAIGDNKLLITDALDNGAGYYIVWVSFEVTEKANYTFTGDGILALVYDSAYAAVSGTELDVGTYNVCVAFLTPATTGIATVKVEKTAIGGEVTPEPELPALQLGDNTVTIDGTVVNLTQKAIAWLEFVVAEDGIYTVSSADLNCYIYSEMDLASADACLCKWTGTAELTAGTYYVCVGKEGVTGEFTVKAEKLGDDVELPAVNTLQVGDNVYVLNQALKDIGYEFMYLVIGEDGKYEFSGLIPLTIYIWPDYPDEVTVPETAPFVWNYDPYTYEQTDSIQVDLVKGTYLVGFRYDAKDAEEKDLCVPGEYEISITRVGDMTHEHNFVEGKCECGETDPNYVAPGTPDDGTPEPEVKLNFFQKIWKAISEFFAKIGSWFKGLFSKKNA